MKKLIVLLLAVVPLVVYAQTNKPLLVKTGKLFDSEAGEFKTGLDIIIKNGRIEEVKADKEINDTERVKYTQIDLSNLAILPGLIDTHTHLLFKEELVPNSNFSSVSLEKRLTMDGDAFRALYGSARARAYLHAGITTVQDLGNSGKFADIALKKAINEGLVQGPRMSCSGPGLSGEGGQLPGLLHQHRGIVDDEFRIVSGVDDALRAVRENIVQGANVIKVYSDNAPNKIMLSVEEMHVIVSEAHRYGIKVTAHATSNQSVYNAVIAGVDGIEHGYSIADSTLALMAKKGVILVATDMDKASLRKYIIRSTPDSKDVDEQIIEHQKRAADRLQRALKAGVTIAYGSDDYADIGLPFAEPSKRTLVAYNEEGVAISRVLQFATINAAKQVNRSNVLGIIKQGYLADIIAVDLNIDRDISAILNVRFVMKGGETIVSR